MTGTHVPGAARHRRAGATAALIACAWLAGVARADTGAEIGGRVTDRQGRGIPDADVVVTDVDGRVRRAGVTDRDGRFFLPVSDSGVRRLSIYTERGARLAILVLLVPSGGRLWVEATDADFRVTSGQGSELVPWLAPRSGTSEALARGRDLAGALQAVPGSAAPAPPAEGPVLLGTDPAEALMRLDGFLLNDPVDGRAPWELPGALFATASPVFGLGPASSRQSGQAEVSLASERPERPRHASLELAGGFASAAGEALGSERPTGWSGTGFARAAVGATGLDGRVRGRLVLAPSRGAFEADPQSVLAARARRSGTLPFLARVEGEAGRWNLGMLGLGSFARWSHGRAARIVPPRDPLSVSRDLVLLGATGRRPAATGPGELLLRAGLLRSVREAVLQGDPPSRTVGSRATVAAHVSTDGELWGWHLVGMGAGLDASWARRSSREPSRQANLLLTSARGTATTPWVAFDDRYRPVPQLEVELGLRLEKAFFEGRAEAEGAPALDRSFATGFLIAPRLEACLRPGDSGSRLCLLAGRFGAGLPLGPMLEATAQPSAPVGAPAEDAVLATGEVRFSRLALSFFALERRSAHIVEDRFSPVSGQLELHEPRGVRRRMRALAGTALYEARRSRAGAALLLGRLDGNHVGYLDAGIGQVRPAGTAEWDVQGSPVNRQGPLPFDRPWSARLMVEHRRPLAGLEVGLIALGRLDAGTPLSALGRSAESGVGQVFLVNRGSLGRTDPVGSLDLLVRVSRMWGGSRVSASVEGFNLTNHRPVVAREQVYTDQVVSPREGASGQAGLGELRDRDGNPVAVRPEFRTPVAWAEPLLIRLGFGVEF